MWHPRSAYCLFASAFLGLVERGLSWIDDWAATVVDRIDHASERLERCPVEVRIRKSGNWFILANCLVTVLLLCSFPFVMEQMPEEPQQFLAPMNQSSTSISGRPAFYDSEECIEDILWRSSSLEEMMGVRNQQIRSTHFGPAAALRLIRDERTRKRQPRSADGPPPFAATQPPDGPATGSTKAPVGSEQASDGLAAEDEDSLCRQRSQGAMGTIFPFFVALLSGWLLNLEALQVLSSGI